MDVRSEVSPVAMPVAESALTPQSAEAEEQDASSPSAPARSRLLPRTVAALCRREAKKFVRDRSRLFGALAQPLAFWLLLGLGFQGTFQMPGGAGTGYLEFLFPGIVALMVLFTAIFSTISVVDERREGFLQAALVAPVPRLGLALGNATGGTLLAGAQAVLFLAAAPLVGLPVSLAGLAFALGVCLLAGLGFTALGFAIAWQMESTRGYHAVMNVLLLPLWILSGAPFPAEGAAPVLRWVVYANPVSYAVSGLRQGLYGFGPATPGALATPGVCLLVTAAFAGAMLLLAARQARRPLF
jgi:ABC-2 type transport system permease protein